MIKATGRKHTTYFWQRPVKAANLGTQLRIKRDMQLIVRYYFHTTIHGRNYYKAIQLLIQEMHVSEATVWRVLDEYKDELNELIATGVKVDTLRVHFRHMSWEKPVKSTTKNPIRYIDRENS